MLNQWQNQNKSIERTFLGEIKMNKLNVSKKYCSIGMYSNKKNIFNNSIKLSCMGPLSGSSIKSSNNTYDSQKSQGLWIMNEIQAKVPALHVHNERWETSMQSLFKLWIQFGKMDAFGDFHIDLFNSFQHSTILPGEKNIIHALHVAHLHAGTLLVCL